MKNKNRMAVLCVVAFYALMICTTIVLASVQNRRFAKEKAILDAETANLAVNAEKRIVDAEKQILELCSAASE